jgi:cation-transporting ATPase F
VNDAPALKAADIGIAMGKGGTDVARDAADLVLADDNFASIYAAVHEGRATFDNVRKATYFLLSTAAAEIVALVVALSLRWPLLLLPTQILWLNLVTNGVQDVALGFEPAEPGILERPPRPRREGVMSALLWKRTVLISVVMAAGMLLMFRWELDRTGSVEEARTVALTTMVLFQTFHLGNVRSERRSAFRTSPLSNRFLLVSAVTALAVHAIALYLPVTQYVLHVEPIGLDAWIRATAVGASIIVVGEIDKYAEARWARHRARPSPSPTH